MQEFNRDTRPLTFLDVSVVAEAFLHHENRKVDKGGCISFRGKKYETKPALIGHTVEISYDPMAPDTLTIRYPGMEPFAAAPLQIGSYCSQEQAIPGKHASGAAGNVAPSGRTGKETPGIERTTGRCYFLCITEEGGTEPCMSSSLT